MPGACRSDEVRVAASQQLINEMLADHVVEAKRIREATRSEYEDNLVSLQALDKAMYIGTGGISLSDLLVPEKSRPQTLSPSETQYFVNSENLPGGVCVDFGCARRSCRLDKETGKTRLECEWGGVATGWPCSNVWTCAQSNCFRGICFIRSPMCGAGSSSTRCTGTITDGI